MTETHTATCWTNAGSLVTEELDLQGLWDATVPTEDGTDLFIPAWAMTVSEVTAMWLSEGTVTCRCNESHANDTTEEPTMTETTAPAVRFTAARVDGRWKVLDAETGTAATAASRAKAEERAAKLNAAEAATDEKALRAEVRAEEAAQDAREAEEDAAEAARQAAWDAAAEAKLEVVTLDGEETTVTVAETPAVESPSDARTARAAELAELVNAGKVTFEEAAAELLTLHPVVAAPAPRKATAKPAAAKAETEPMRSLWVAAAFVPIILADTAPERATLVAKLDASVPNNRGGRTVRLTRAEAEELAAIGTEIENAAGGTGRNAHSARTMRDRLARLWG